MSTSRARWLLVVGIALVALNLRPGLAGVGPLVDDIRGGTGLSNPALGFLTTLPLLAFAGLSLFASGVARRIGMERAIGLALVLIGVGTAARAVPAVAALYLGTAVFGVGVALGNVLLPALSKRHFEAHSGAITSLYSSMMGVGAAAAAGVSVPLAARLGWRGALGIWALPAVVALLVWLPQMARSAKRRSTVGSVTLQVLVRSPLAWRIALYMGLQSLTFYVILAWLPDLLQSRGLAQADAGGLLALSQITGTLGSALIPIWAGRIRDHRVIVWTLGGLEAASLAGLLLPNAEGAVIWVGVLGFVLGGTFALALTLLLLRSPDAEATGELSGMAQAGGYFIAALAPPLVGLLRDATAGWTLPIAFLYLTLAGKVAAGIPIGRPGTVGDER